MLLETGDKDKSPNRPFLFNGVSKMATVEASSAIDRIGEIAGQIWHLLDISGPTRVTQLIKEIEAPRDTIMQAIGWLAREEKIRIEEISRSRVISLL